MDYLRWYKDKQGTVKQYRWVFMGTPKCSILIKNFITHHFPGKSHQELLTVRNIVLNAQGHCKLPVQNNRILWNGNILNVHLYGHLQQKNALDAEKCRVSSPVDCDLN